MSEEKVPAASKLKNSQDNPTTTQLIQYENVDTFIKDGYKTHMLATRHANALPKDRDYDFYNAHTSFKKTIGVEGDRILGLINKILRRNDVEGNIKNRPLDERVELVVEANDFILERVANSIDDLNGLRKLPEQPVVQTVSAELPVNGSWNRKGNFSINTALNTSKEGTKSISLLAGKNIIRPQKFFKDKIDNSNNYPWMPRITEKPNSLKPLALQLIDTDQGEVYCHPYEVELDKFVPSEELLKECKPVQPKKIEVTPLIEVSTPEQLRDLLEDLRKYKEIAVDLEHHSYRTFQGITCLMQISTVDTDYLVDTLTLRDKLHVLNEVFTKNSIVKIFHGADCDIQWLQRDLSLYIVNMFDTHKAAKQLGYSGLSLSYLLNRYCSFLPNKQFQLADWRIRPLPDELKSYAREDTHYLIYIYHRLRNELLKRANGADNLLKSVFQASTEVCKKQYIKPILTETSHLDFYRKCKRSFDNRQMYALKELYQWRDTMAREEDESTSYVLPNHMMLQIAEMLPREVQGVLACCNPIPPLVKANSLEIHQIMLRSREQPLEKPIMKDDSRTCSAKESIKLNIDSPLHCPHDLTKLQDFRDDLPTLLGSSSENMATMKDSFIAIERQKSAHSVFNSTQKVLKAKRVELPKFLGPYERYKLIKPFIQAEEKKALEEKKNAAVDDKPEDPSVEDRIASLHEHFVKVKKTIDNPPEVNNLRAPQESLLALGGVKKRKRDHSQESNDQEESPVQNSYLTTIPTSRKQGIKRQRDDWSASPKQTEKNSPKKGMSVKRGDDSGKGSPGNKRGKDRGAKRGQGDRKSQQDGGNTEEPNEKRGKGSFQPFDYSAVDFNQFQGGASGAAQAGLKSNFKGKNKSKGGFRGKSNNKSFTFGSGGNRRGRGR